MDKLFLLFNTVRRLKAKQVVFQLWYRIKKIKPLHHYSIDLKEQEFTYLNFSDLPGTFSYATEEGTFNFLNQRVSFNKSIDWNYMENGKLWNYNLHYANYILQEDITPEKRLEWLESLHEHLNESSVGLEPYPVSLRIINTIRFICRHKITAHSLLKDIQAEASFLSGRVEFHLLGNHLLENAFALLMAGAFFKRQDWIATGHSLIKNQLEEQILSDGAHFELSPMYHQIIFYRLLELIDWYSKWESRKETALQYFRSVAEKMLIWLKNMTFANGDIPLMNDSADHITFTSEQLFRYSELLKLSGSGKFPLADSGYRAFKNEQYECVIDAGKISADYQPGHGHADALSFILYVKGQPVLVERGTSTYQIGNQRSLERSTAAHNTLVYKNMNQSQVWGGFRVGSRANISIQEDHENVLKASHDGYQKFGYTHQREFIAAETSLTINDGLISKKEINPEDAVVYFHVYPNLSVSISGDEVTISNIIRIKYVGAVELEQENYKFASQYNKYTDGILLKVKMKASLKTIIYIL